MLLMWTDNLMWMRGRYKMEDLERAGREEYKEREVETEQIGLEIGFYKTRLD